MEFDVKPIVSKLPGLEVEYFLVPWDSNLLGFKVAQIDRLRVTHPGSAQTGFETFKSWCRKEGVRFCSCRVPHDHTQEALLLQQSGFRFIELNYRPCLDLMGEIPAKDHQLEIQPASVSDRDSLVNIAGKIFEHGRFHQDSQLGPELGNQRYANWMRNSFEADHQHTYVFRAEGQILGFVVIEYPGENRAFWSLVGLAPHMKGKGLGKQVISAMAHYHRQQGLRWVETSISSHNTPIFNLYVNLGYRFPAPSVTFHWHA